MASLRSGRHVLQKARSFLKSTPKLKSHSNFTGPSPTPIRRNTFFSSREPVELSGVMSMMPLHTATASSLLKSMLSSKVGQWGTLSEGFATPL